MCIESATFSTVRETRKEEPMAVSPSRAIAQAGRRLTWVLQTHGPQAIALCVPPEIAAESQYVAVKFARTTLRGARTFENMIDAAAAIDRGVVRALWVLGDPAADTIRVRRALLNTELLIVQHDLITLACPDIFFPSAHIADPPEGSIKPDWWWTVQVALAMGFRAGFRFDAPSQIRTEMSEVAD
jgi:predicted molibdopterin-dependent oxidoreductase YjgC